MMGLFPFEQRGTTLEQREGNISCGDMCGIRIFQLKPQFLHGDCFIDQYRVMC